MWAALVRRGGSRLAATHSGAALLARAPRHGAAVLGPARRALSAVAEAPEEEDIVGARAAEFPSNVSFSDIGVLQPPKRRPPKQTQAPFADFIKVEVQKFFPERADGAPEPTQVEFCGTIDLPWRVYCEPLRTDLLNDYVKWQRTNKRGISRKTKSRGEIRGSTKKIMQQKGTGRARVGSARSPIRRGGSKAHGPKRRLWKSDMNKKARKKAMRVALSAKLREGNLIVVDHFNLEEAKTKYVHDVMRLRGWKSAYFLPEIIGTDMNDNFVLASQNLPLVKTHKRQLRANVYDILKYEKLVLSVDAVKALAKRLAPTEHKFKYEPPAWPAPAPPPDPNAEPPRYRHPK
ncbi:ribosomal protein L4 domain-containing protein [Pelagophyceae sp. CCMP2097]|nr:ribosomal protein L4 domain-containing protein [Pelagophyceae sp. CCMP2097]